MGAETRASAGFALNPGLQLFRSRCSRQGRGRRSLSSLQPRTAGLCTCAQTCQRTGHVTPPNVALCYHVTQVRTRRSGLRRWRTMRPSRSA